MTNPGDERFDFEKAATWNTPLIADLDMDTLLYVRESMAGLVHVDGGGHRFEEALALVDEIVRLRTEHPFVTPGQARASALHRYATRERTDV